MSQLREEWTEAGDTRPGAVTYAIAIGTGAAAGVIAAIIGAFLVASVVVGGIGMRSAADGGATITLIGWLYQFCVAFVIAVATAVVLRRHDAPFRHALVPGLAAGALLPWVLAVTHSGTASQYLIGATALVVGAGVGALLGARRRRGQPVGDRPGRTEAVRQALFRTLDDA